MVTAGAFPSSVPAVSAANNSDLPNNPKMRNS